MDLAALKDRAVKAGLSLECGVEPWTTMGPGWRSVWARIQRPDGKGWAVSHSGGGPDLELLAYAKFARVVDNLSSGAAQGMPSPN